MAVETSTGNPYSESKISENKFVRTFDEKVDNDELVWHKDKRNRTIKVLNGEGWKLQYDNHLPIELVNGKLYYIVKETFHRIHKGKGKLELEIIEE